MNIESMREMIEADGPSKVLGMEYLSTPDENTCQARMKVADCNTQPFGYLSGGVSVALAETLAGVGSCAMCPGQICVGLTVQANHISSAFRGDTVTATARCIHRGRTTHVWNVEVRNGKDQLVSTVNVTNYIKPVAKQ